MIARHELRRLDAHRLALLIPLKVRFLPALASGWLLYALAGTGGIASGPRVVALGLCVVSALAALYDDRWIFDDNEKKATRRVGLLFAARETSLDMAALRRVVLRGDPAIPGASTLALEEAFGRSHTLARCRDARLADLRAAAAPIAAFCGLPLLDLTTTA